MSHVRCVIVSHLCLCESFVSLCVIVSHICLCVLSTCVRACVRVCACVYLCVSVCVCHVHHMCLYVMCPLYHASFYVTCVFLCHMCISVSSTSLCVIFPLTVPRHVPVMPLFVSLTLNILLMHFLRPETGRN